MEAKVLVVVWRLRSFLFVVIVVVCQNVHRRRRLHTKRYVIVHLIERPILHAIVSVTRHLALWSIALTVIQQTLQLSICIKLYKIFWVFICREKIPTQRFFLEALFIGNVSYVLSLDFITRFTFHFWNLLHFGYCFTFAFIYLFRLRQECD